MRKRLEELPVGAVFITAQEADNPPEKGVTLYIKEEGREIAGRCFARPLNVRREERKNVLFFETDMVIPVNKLTLRIN